MDIKFMTAHASKGLQRDFVFLLCCSGGLKGFPSAIPEEPLLGLLLPEVERMPHAEERRLFYVAMTRCKKKLFFRGGPVASVAFHVRIARQDLPEHLP